MDREEALRSRAHIAGLAGHWWHPLWFGMTVTGVLIVVGIMALTNVHGHDALAYWIVDPADPYSLRNPGLSGSGVFRYSPTAALLVSPLGALPWNVFTTVWLAAELGVLWLLAGRWWLALVLLPPVTLDLFAGNIDLFLALLVAASFRYPGAWAVVGLTKVTPIVGALWFVGRRDWRGVGWVSATFGLLVIGTVAATGVRPWEQWFHELGSWAGAGSVGLHVPIGLLPRVLTAAAVAYYAGVTNRAWLVPIAVVIAMPVLWIIAFTPLVALAPQIRERYSETLGSRGVGPLAARRITTPTATPVMTTEPAMASVRASGIVQPSGGTATSRSRRKVIANTIHATAIAGRPRARSRNTNAG